MIAPTDAIAATSIAKRIGLPQRVVDILEGESLLNDASGLLALEFGIAMVIGGQTPTVGYGLLRLLYLTAVGIGIGLLVGVIVDFVEHRIDDSGIEIAISLLVPYAAYLAADSIHASGVLAVVACGLYLSRMSSHFFSPEVRLRAQAVWDSLTFILNGLVFVLIGLQLPQVLEGIRGYSMRQLLLYGALFSALVILLRLIWIFPGAYVSNIIRRRLLHQKERMPPARQVFVAGWSGMRGVIALAAAIALPQTLANGQPFAQRNLIIFLAFSVILVTLVFQGLTLPLLVRALGLAGTSAPSTEEPEARRIILQAALSYLEEARKKELGDFEVIYDDLTHHYRHRLTTLGGRDTLEDGSGPEHYKRYLDLSREMLQLERQTAVRLRNQGRISDELLRKFEHELDLGEAKLLAVSA